MSGSLQQGHHPRLMEDRRPDQVGLTLQQPEPDRSAQAVGIDERRAAADGTQEGRCIIGLLVREVVDQPAGGLLRELPLR